MTFPTAQVTHPSLSTLADVQRVVRTLPGGDVMRVAHETGARNEVYERLLVMTAGRVFNRQYITLPASETHVRESVAFFLHTINRWPMRALSRPPVEGV